MRQSGETRHHEVRLRAAAWARRLVEWHGDGAEQVVRTTLKRPDLSEDERLAARFTRDALHDLRRRQGFAAPRAPRSRFAWLGLFWRRGREPGGAEKGRLSHQ